MACAFQAIFVLLAACAANSQLDLTIVPNQAGEGVTSLSLSRIQSSPSLDAVFGNDNRLLRRIAYVETRDGVDPLTYSDPAYNGGIWRVDERIYNETLNPDDHPEIDLVRIYVAIVEAFGLDWTVTTWVDLRRPLLSALAARILLSVNVPIPSVGDIRGQGEYWKQFYNSNPEYTVERFIADVNELEFIECPRVGLDLAFVFDSSGSVGEQNFELEIEFAVAVVETFAIGPTDTLVGAIAYSNFADVSFFLDTFTDRESVIQALREIEFIDVPGPSTNTADALTRLREDVLSPSGGIRGLLSTGIPRIAVVITDGRSNVNTSLTIPSALALRDEGVLVYAIGVGNNLRVEELEAIASGPDFIVRLSDFDVTEFVGLQRIISEEACLLPVPVPIEVTIESTLEGGQMTFFSFQLPTQGMTLRLEVQSGGAVMYASNKVQNPGAAFYDYIIETRQSGDVFIDPTVLSDSSSVSLDGRRKRQDDNGGSVGTGANFTDTVVYVTVEGVNDVNVFTLGSTFGDTSSSVPASLSSGAIVGIVAGVFTLLLLFAGLAVLILCVTKQRCNSSSKETQQESIYDDVVINKRKANVELTDMAYRYGPVRNAMKSNL